MNLVFGDFNGDGIDDVLFSSVNFNLVIVFGKEIWSSGVISNVNVLNEFLFI